MKFSKVQIIGLIIIIPYVFFVSMGIMGHIKLIKKPYLLFLCLIIAVGIYHGFELQPVLEYYWYK